MDPLTQLRSELPDLRAKRDTLIAERDALRDAVEKRDDKALTEAEEASYRELARDIATISDDLAAKADRVAELADLEAREQAANAALRGLPATTGSVQVRREPLTYERGNRQQSYFRDLGLAHVGGDEQARQRLASHRSQMDVELPKLEARYDQARFDRNVASAIGDRQAAEAVLTRDITRVDGAGGEFVPPLWLVEEFAEFARFGRPYADHIRNIPLPTGTDSISLPRITTGAQSAAQTADNAAVNEVDIVTNVATGPVRTIAGQQDIALQLLEQSPIMFDEVVFSDLIADYNFRLDAQLINGSGASGQHTGALVLAGTNALTYTDGTPTVPELWPSGAQMISQAVGNRRMSVTGHFMHPRRWYWMSAALDGQNRPLIVPEAAGPNNAMASITAAGVAEGPVGFWHGVPVYLDGAIPTNLGAGTNEDAIITQRGPDQILFEGAIRTRALPEVLSGNLTVRLQVYAYSSFIPGRFPAGISKLNGTGLTAPVGF